MRKVLLIIILQIFITLGCTSQNVVREARYIPPPKIDTAKIMKKYLSISRHDGIDLEEAVLLAQSEMIFRGFGDGYHLDKPMVEFVDRKTWGIRFYPVNRSYRDAIKNHSILVGVGKREGHVRWHPTGMSYLLIGEYGQGSKRVNKVYEVSN